MLSFFFLSCKKNTLKKQQEIQSLNLVCDLINNEIENIQEQINDKTLTYKATGNDFDKNLLIIKAEIVTRFEKNKKIIENSKHINELKRESKILINDVLKSVNKTEHQPTWLDSILAPNTLSYRHKNDLLKKGYDLTISYESFLNKLSHPSSSEFVKIKLLSKIHFLFLEREVLQFIDKQLTNEFKSKRSEKPIIVTSNPHKIFKKQQNIKLTLYLTYPYLSQYRQINYSFNNGIKISDFQDDFKNNTIKLKTNDIGDFCLKGTFTIESIKRQSFEYNYKVIK